MAELPIEIRRTPFGLQIIDGTAKVICYFYSEENPSLRIQAMKLSPEEAEDAAKICARALTDWTGN